MMSEQDVLALLRKLQTIDLSKWEAGTGGSQTYNLVHNGVRISICRQSDFWTYVMSVSISVDFNSFTWKEGDSSPVGKPLLRFFQKLQDFKADRASEEARRLEAERQSHVRSAIDKL